MAKFSKGDLVIDVKTDHTGSIVRVLPLMRGKQMYEDLQMDDKFRSLKISTIQPIR